MKAPGNFISNIEVKEMLHIFGNKFFVHRNQIIVNNKIRKCETSLTLTMKENGCIMLILWVCEHWHLVDIFCTSELVVNWQFCHNTNLVSFEDQGLGWYYEHHRVCWYFDCVCWYFDMVCWYFYRVCWYFDGSVSKYQRKKFIIPNLFSGPIHHFKITTALSKYQQTLWCS